jgi:small-conductance mechanosensitive channel
MLLLLETPTPTTLPQPTTVTPGELWSALTATVLPLAVPFLESLVVAVAALVVGGRLRRIARGSLIRVGADVAIVFLIGQLVYFAVLSLGAIWVLAIFGVPPAGLVAAFGAVGLAVSLSLQDVLKNLVAGLYLLVEKPFRPGDRLMVRTFEGVVENVDVRTTTLLTPVGERVLVPNAILFAEVLVNRGAPKAPVELEQAEEGPTGC